jgi:hypothetical protein
MHLGHDSTQVRERRLASVDLHGHHARMRGRQLSRLFSRCHALRDRRVGERGNLLH